MKATMIRAIIIWNAIGKRQVTVEGSRNEKPRSIQYEIITPKTMRVPTSEKSVMSRVFRLCDVYHLQSSPFGRDDAIWMSQTATSVQLKCSCLPAVSIVLLLACCKGYTLLLTITKSGDQTRSDKLAEAEGRTLYGCADNHNA